MLSMVCFSFMSDAMLQVNPDRAEMVHQVERMIMQAPQFQNVEHMTREGVDGVNQCVLEYYRNMSIDEKRSLFFRLMGVKCHSKASFCMYMFWKIISKISDPMENIFGLLGLMVPAIPVIVGDENFSINKQRAANAICSMGVLFFSNVKKYARNSARKFENDELLMQATTNPALRVVLDADHHQDPVPLDGGADQVEEALLDGDPAPEA
jgi:hypothetical protein